MGAARSLRIVRGACGAFEGTRGPRSLRLSGRRRSLGGKCRGGGRGGGGAEAEKRGRGAAGGAESKLGPNLDDQTRGARLGVSVGSLHLRRDFETHRPRPPDPYESSVPTETRVHPSKP